MIQKNLPKYYAQINSSLPKEYSDYDNYSPDWGYEASIKNNNRKQDFYEAYKKIGRGKYSEVFEGIDTRSMKKVIIKVLKPVRKRKIRREIKILNTLKGGPNIIEIVETVRDSATKKTPSLIFNYLDNVEFRSLFTSFTHMDVRYYLFELLKALDYAHSKGIMHRDVKPQNIIVDPKNKVLKLIDWGLAEFYIPGQDYNVRVASRYFKGPELLVDNTFYDYSLDIWSTGTMFASMIFLKEPFFQGDDNYDQLVKITKVLGTDDLLAYVKKYDLKLDSAYDKILGNQSKKEWSKFITHENQHLCTSDAIDLLSLMLVYDHSERITPRDAMQHHYFLPLLNI